MFPLQLLNIADEVGLPVEELDTEPEPEVTISEVVTEPEIPDIYKFLTILNIILWILYFLGAFDD